MRERTYETPKGVIHYWVDVAPKAAPALLLLPGLTADHRLFDRQVEHFAGRNSVLVWDAPGHGASWPFELDFSLTDKARWLEEIRAAEGLERPVIVGQSMGGYVGQAYDRLYPGRLAGFVSIDSAPMGREYVTDLERWLLKRMEPVYRRYPWKALLRQGTRGVSTTPYGRTLMRDIMLTYDGDQQRYARLAGHGFRMLAEGMEWDGPCVPSCPTLLICGRKDHAGSCMRCNRAWHRRTGLPLEWIDGAGHNANTDAPEVVNRLIKAFIKRI